MSLLVISLQKTKQKQNTKPTQIGDPDFLNLLRNNFSDDKFCLPILFLFCVNLVLVIDQDQMSLISEATESRTLIVSLLSITVLSLSFYLSFLVWKRKIIQSMICQHEIHFTTQPLESQWNCEIAVFNNIWLMAFEGGTEKVNKVSFLQNVLSAAFSYLPCGIFGNFSHRSHNQVDLSHAVL